MGAAKRKQELLTRGELFIEPKDMRGMIHPCEETPEGDLLITDGPYKGYKIRQARPRTGEHGEAGEAEICGVPRGCLPDSPG